MLRKVRVGGKTVSRHPEVSTKGETGTRSGRVHAVVLAEFQVLVLAGRQTPGQQSRAEQSRAEQSNIPN
ncbi:hypothetical protein E2C01_063309 [Portunus trituberculatus]|uniref:Uncharacterized protein n=1 Tax=Portunus trituberculatus TaxID=210409 RepID=A0A5B7HKG9_PORTR|nr:hypothetical protein [Portunus trituberculatus]